MAHLGSKKREERRERRAAKTTAPRARRVPDAVAAATGLSGTYCSVHGTTHSPEAAREMGCFE